MFVDADESNLGVCNGKTTSEESAGSEAGEEGSQEGSQEGRSQGRGQGARRNLIEFIE